MKDTNFASQISVFPNSLYCIGANKHPLTLYHYQVYFPVGLQ